MPKSKARRQVSAKPIASEERILLSVDFLGFKEIVAETAADLARLPPPIATMDALAELGCLNATLTAAPHRIGQHQGFGLDPASGSEGLPLRGIAGTTAQRADFAAADIRRHRAKRVPQRLRKSVRFRLPR